MAWLLGCLVVYGALFGTGYVIYGRSLWAVVCLGVAGVAAVGLARAMRRVSLTD
jgi:hypothetical protein